MTWSLGIDLGTSACKASLFSAADNKVFASASWPEEAMPIHAPEQLWAEQNPVLWWEAVCGACAKLRSLHPHEMSRVEAVGICAQMHGLVLLDKHGELLRPAIIWCDGRAGAEADQLVEALGREYFLERIGNLPGQFTASKLAWVAAHEPACFRQIGSVLLPADYLAYRLCKEITTTRASLSEATLLDTRQMSLSEPIIAKLGLPRAAIPAIIPALGEGLALDGQICRSLGLAGRARLTYRAGDQLANAFALGAFSEGEVAATAGTSGVLFGVSGKALADQEGKSNTFLHVAGSENPPLFGTLLCLNGAGISYEWLRTLFSTKTPMTFKDMDALAEKARPGSAGLTILPFGNGPERMFGAWTAGGRIDRLNFRRHRPAELARGTIEAVAIAMSIGADYLAARTGRVSCIRMAKANLGLSDLFCATIATLCNCEVERRLTDGAQGAARGAACGAKWFASARQAAQNADVSECIAPDQTMKPGLAEAKQRFLAALTQTHLL